MVNIQTQRYFVSFYSSARGTARGDTKLGASHDESMGFFSHTRCFWGCFLRKKRPRVIDIRYRLLMGQPADAMVDEL